MISVLIDTNLLVYMYDLSESEKRRRSIKVLQSVYEAESGALSTQMLSEFYNAVTRKLEPPLTAPQAEDQLHRLARVWPVFPVTSQVAFEAARGVRQYQFSFWDAQVWAVARLNHIPLVLSEDFKPGAVIEGVRFANPLETDSQPTDWKR